MRFATRTSTSEYRLKIGALRERGQFGPKFQVQVVVPTYHCSYLKTRTNVLSCAVKMRAQVSFVLSQSTHLTDRQTFP